MLVHSLINCLVEIVKEFKFNDIKTMQYVVELISSAVHLNVEGAVMQLKMCHFMSDTFYKKKKYSIILLRPNTKQSSFLGKVSF